MTTHQKAELRAKRKRIKPQLKRLEKENNQLRREIRKLQLVRWIANDTALTYLYQLRTQYDRNELNIQRFYKEANYQRRTLVDKWFDIMTTAFFPAALFTTMLLLIF